jgi:hypothetical protein
MGAMESSIAQDPLYINIPVHNKQEPTQVHSIVLANSQAPSSFGALELMSGQRSRAKYLEPTKQLVDASTTAKPS